MDVTQLILSVMTDTEGYFLVSLMFVMAAGFLIGFERGSRGEPAGVRTHTLVCFGAMLFSLISNEVDPNSTSRIAANIVTGVGFLGAGIIMYAGGTIRGLTTATSLWLTAAIGMTIGYGYYFISIVSTIAAFVILRLPHIGENRESYVPGAHKPVESEKKVKRPRKRYV